MKGPKTEKSATTITKRLMMAFLAAGIATMGWVSSTAYADNPKQQSDDAKQEQALKQVTYDIKYLASDEMAGRQPGTPGIKLAEDYIIAEYKKAGVKPPAGSDNYFQEMEVGNQRFVDKEKSVLVLKGPQDKKIECEVDENFVTLTARRDFMLDAPIVFVGYGITAADEHNFDELSVVDVKDKIVVMIRREPQQGNEQSVFDGTEVSQHAYIRTKIRAIRNAGAIGIIMVNDGFSVTEEDALVEEDQFGIATRRMPFVHVKRSVIDEMLDVTPVVAADSTKLSTLSDIEKMIDDKLEPLSQTIEGWSAQMEGAFKVKGVVTNNIVGVVEGEGPLADETIVIGAHYDHLGMGAYGSRAGGRREIHNGADDNATGTAAVIELARRFAQREKKPARRMVFVCFTAEEMGLLGAKHYVENPIYPLEKTVAMINFDMIGWLRDDRLTVYNWNSSAAFEPILDKANESFNFDLNKPKSGFAGSDHLPFFQKSIPVMFIHTGITQTYHTPEDDFETLDCPGALKVIDYTERILDGIDALEKAPEFGTPVASRPVRLGVILKTENDVVSIENVSDGSIAKRSGLQAGDIIVAINDEAITARRQVTRAVRRDEGKTVKFKIKRDDVEITLNVTLKKEEVQ